MPSVGSGTSTWVVGDVHGCFETLLRLLERTGIDRDRDRLILIGDLVNRGPRSLEVLGWAVKTARSMAGRFEALLGNHDLHLVARAAGLSRGRAADTLDEILEHPQRDELLAWLARRPLALRIEGGLIVHAGVLPPWTVEETLWRASRLQTMLGGPAQQELLRRRPDLEHEPHDEIEEWRRDLAVLTRARMLDPVGRASAYSGHPDDAPAGLNPWFAVAGRRTASSTVIFGHWAALGLYLGKGLYGLDTGCAWGRCLTALRLEDGAILQQDVVDDERPTGNASPGRR
ncbi:MAG TPA: symmetrical bis(5'-nucleosyl)-tetraphosphatase [Thermoanaerobaculia bacterium]|nr:symmetrical bis(5'-nucleosyl)-tetraphosphatase [Thermoanaerobaculia bacterium]